MIDAGLAAGLFVSVPIVGRIAIRRSRLPISGIARIAIDVAAGMTLWSVPLLVAVIGGAYQPAILGAVGWIVSACWAIVLLRAKQCRNSANGRQNTTWRTRSAAWTIALALGLLAAGLAYGTLVADPVITGRDMAVYGLRGAYIAEHGRMDLPYPPGTSPGDLPPGWIELAGVYSTQPSRTIQFGPLYPTWLAQSFEVGGVEAMLRLNPVLAVLAALAVYAAARRWTPAPIAVLVTLFVALNAAQIWVARTTLSEIFSQLLVWCALFLLAVPAGKQRPVALAWAGAFIGLAAVIRIDGLVILPLVIGGHAVAAALDHERYAPAAIVPFYATAVPACGFAAASYALLSGPYFEDLRPQLVLVALATAAAATLYAASLARPIAARAAAAMMSTRFRVIASALVVSVAAYAYLVRPALGPFDTIDAPGHPLSGTRSHIEDAMRNLGAYLAPPTVWLAVLGWLAAITTALRRRPLVIPVLAVIGGFGVVYFWNQSIFPDHFWAIRRFIPVILPGAVVLAGLGGWLILRMLPAPMRAVAYTLAVVALALQTWRVATPLLLVAERDGSSDAIRRFSEGLPATQSYLGLFTTDGARSLATPLVLLGDRQVVPLDVRSAAGRAEALRQLSAASPERPIWVITNLPEEAATLRGRVVMHVVHTYEFMLPTTNPVPSQVGSARFELWAIEVTGLAADGTPSVGAVRD